MSYRKSLMFSCIEFNLQDVTKKKLINFFLRFIQLNLNLYDIFRNMGLFQVLLFNFLMRNFLLQINYWLLLSFNDLTV